MSQRNMIIGLAALSLFLCGTVAFLLLRERDVPQTSEREFANSSVVGDVPSQGSRGIGGSSKASGLPPSSSQPATSTTQTNVGASIESPTSSPAELEVMKLRYEQELQDQERRLDAELSTLVAAVGDVERFSSRLGRLSKTYPKAKVASSFREVSVEAPLWKAVRDWSQLYKLADNATGSPLSPADAKRLVSQGDRMVREARVEAYAEWFDDSRERLMSITGRVDFGGQRMDESLKRFLDEPLMGSVVLVEDLGTKQQFFLKNMGSIEPPLGTRVPFYYITDHDLNVRRATITKGLGRHADPAPHCRLANEIRDRLRSSENLSSAWDSVFLELLELILVDKDANPFPKWAIYRETLGVACRGSATLRKTFQDHLRDLQSAGISRNAKWFDPNDRDGRIATQEAKNVLENLTPITTLREQARGQIVSEDRARVAAVEWIAYLSRAADGEWKAVGVDGSSSDGELFVVARDQNLKARLFPVGTLKQGRAQWVAKDWLLEGRPLFVRPSVNVVRP